MPEPKDESFFRKVVRFVANPATDWAELSSRQHDDAALEMERSELKAMVERKRRNDFVRKREFDVLRKVRREGLSPEQLAALGGSSRLDDSEARMSESRPAPQDHGVKAKIDEIEQQMVGDALVPTRPSPFDARARNEHMTTTRPAVMGPPVTPPGAMPPSYGLPPSARGGQMPMDDGDEPLPPLPPLPDLDAPMPVAAAARPQPYMAPGLSPLTPPSRPAEGGLTDFGHPFSVEVSEVVHDPELDEAVIAFANADFVQCEQALADLTAPTGVRSQHAETWLVLFDLYRATGQQHKFENLAVEYAHQFGWSAPQWYSLPRMVADAAAAAEERPQQQRRGGDVGWIAPEVLDIDAVARLRSQTLQMPLPWVFDWGGLRSVDAEAATHLSELFRQWADESLDMRWVAGEQLLTVLQDAAPTGVRDADPAFWVARLDALRLANRPDQFDEAAIDYCVTYEVSPPSWERARCQVRISVGNNSTQSPMMSQVSEISTSFLESSLTEDASAPGGVRMATLELAGQPVGDIGATLQQLDEQLGAAPLVTVSCTKLIRVDFIAAGDLLNWVLSKRGENRTVSFVDAHRLVALFYGAMGINEHAKVRVRTL